MRKLGTYWNVSALRQILHNSLHNYVKSHYVHTSIDGFEKYFRMFIHRSANIYQNPRHTWVLGEELGEKKESHELFL